MSAWNAPPPSGGGGAVTGAGNDEWAEHKAPNGRIYYFNKLSQKSVWEKPESMMTAGEKHLANCPWKSHKNTDGTIKGEIDGGNLRMIFASLQERAEQMAAKKVRYKAA